jgi:hypothetical protein
VSGAAFLRWCRRVAAAALAVVVFHAIWRTVTISADLSMMLLVTGIIAQTFAIRLMDRQRPAQLPPPAVRVPPCRHRNVVPVESVLGDVIAKLCPDCDEQLEAGFEPPAVFMSVPDAVAAASAERKRPVRYVKPPQLKCYCNWCRGRPGVHGAEATALYRAQCAEVMKRSEAMRAADINRRLDAIDWTGGVTTAQLAEGMQKIAEAIRSLHGIPPAAIDLARSRLSCSSLVDRGLDTQRDCKAAASHRCACGRPLCDYCKCEECP